MYWAQIACVIKGAYIVLLALQLPKYFLTYFAVGLLFLSVFLFLHKYRRERRDLKLAVFFIAMLFSLILLFGIIIIRFPDSFFSKISLILGVIAIVALLFFPVFLVVGLFFSAVQMIRKEGHRLPQLLSLGLGILYLTYLIIWPLLNNAFDNVILRFVYIYLSFSFVLFAGIFALYTISSLLNLIKRRHKYYKYIIVLGSGLKDGMEVTPLLASRVDKGIELFYENPGSLLILSGGKGSDEKLAESEAMFNFALSRAVPEEGLIIENKSSNTRENLLFSKALIDACENVSVALDRDPLEDGKKNKANILVVSNSYHILRALLLARELGIDCDGRGARTKLYFSINAFIREWIAYLVIRRKQFAAVLLFFFLILLILSFIQVI